jgi:hypothetical protein
MGTRTDTRRRRWGAIAAAAVVMALPAGAAEPAAAAAPRITSAPADPTNRTSARVAFSHPRSGVRLRCRLDGRRARSCTSPARYAALAAGRHRFAVWALDRAARRGAAAVHRWTVDLAPPRRPVIQGRPPELTSARAARLRFGIAGAGVLAHCRLDGAATRRCRSPARYAGLAEGRHVFAVRGRDRAGNWSASATHVWRIDATSPPPPAILEGPPAATAATVARFELAAREPGARLRCALDGAAAWCASPATYAGLAEGGHELHVIAVDAAGNASAPAVRRWSVDTTAPPAPTITARPAAVTPRARASFTFVAAEPAASFACRLDGAPPEPCTSPYAVSGPLAAGTHVFGVRARDAAGNRSAETTVSWSVDPAAYAATVLSTPGLAGYWRLGERAWSPAADARGLHPGTYSGGVALGAAGAILDDPDTAAAVDGTSGEVLLPGPPLSTDGTLAGWFDWRSGPVVLRDHTRAGGWILAFESAGRLACRVGDATLVSAVDVRSLRDGWHHFALTRAGSALACYLDGRQVRSGTTSGAASVLPWHVMNNGTLAEQYARGAADEIAIFDVALGAGEIAAHHRLGREPWP